MYKNIKKLFLSKYSFIAYVLLITIESILWWNTTDIYIMLGNYGHFHTYTDVVLSIIIIILFPIFLIAIWYKSWKYWKWTFIDWKMWIWLIWWAIGTIISGASCCWATLAISFWLLPLMSFLPYSWLEIKIIGVLWLIYALYDILKNLETCKTKR